MADDDERDEELAALIAIWPEITITDRYTASLDLPVAPSPPLLIRFVPGSSTEPVSKRHAQAATVTNAHIEHDVHISHLPPLSLRLTLPKGYPGDVAPEVHIGMEHEWLPGGKIKELQRQIVDLWEDFGRCQVLYSYIDQLQTAASTGFGLDESTDGCLILPTSLELELVAFDKATKLKVFQDGAYPCGICLEPKKGNLCYQIEKCGHVFCMQCLQDFFNNAITEGSVIDVRCLDPSCGKGKPGQKARKPKPLHPRELLAMGIEEPMVRRYVDMKRKKRVESDKTTVYCPREWCKAPGRSRKYPPIPEDLKLYPESDSDSEAEIAISHTNNLDGSERLTICENPRCGMAFCKVCYKTWHGPIQRCHPRNPNELSAEEKASYEYIMANTSACPYCNAATQKSMGCNHMQCIQCHTHFCYLCGSWLDRNDPYKHFSVGNSPCYHRLWELEEGDNGQDPEDGEGFMGPRRYEQMAIEVARALDEEERLLAEREDAGEADVDNSDTQREEDLEPEPADAADIIVLNRHIGGIVLAQQPAQEADAPPGPGVARRRRQNPFPVGHQPIDPRIGGRGAAAAVRAYERQRPPNAREQIRGGLRHQRGLGGHAPGGGARGGGLRRRPLPEQDEEIRRFVEMAQRDQEDEWDSDELGDEEAFVIGERQAN